MKYAIYTACGRRVGDRAMTVEALVGRAVSERREGDRICRTGTKAALWIYVGAAWVMSTPPQRPTIHRAREASSTQPLVERAGA